MINCEELAMKPNHGDFKIRIVCLALEAVLKKHFYLRLSSCFYLRLSSIRRTLKPNALLYQSTVFSTSGTYMITYPNFAGPLVWVLAILIIYDSQPDLTACLVLALGYCTSLGTGATNVPRLLSTNASFHIHTLYTYTSLQNLLNERPKKSSLSIQLRAAVTKGEIYIQQLCMS
jgi:hypothetical protein